ncbi:MAG: hypothetical protein GC193_04785 [Cryomorphaceae bacterium]|nr:hypothetical protein [Cryomorphaceae bacterium]
MLFPIGVFYFSYIFGISLEDHNDVQPGTFLWFVTMDNEVINNFPIIDPATDPTFNSIGGGGPNIATGWEIIYESKHDPTILAGAIINYLKANGFDVEAVSETQYYWTGKFRKDNSNLLFSGSNEKGEGLDLLIVKEGAGKQTKVVCSIVY